MSFDTAANLVTGYGAMSALFLHLGLERPSAVDRTVKRTEKVLIWGVSSSFGFFAAQIAAIAGYGVVGVASGRGAELAKDAGIPYFIDRTMDSLVDDITALGPFKAVLAAADTAEDQVKLGAALAKLGGGHFLSTMGVRAGVILPEGVTGDFMQFLDDYLEPANKDFTAWVWWDFFERIFAQDAVKSVPLEVMGGLSKLPEAWDMLQYGKVGGKRLIVSPDLD
jgi:NADPH:quinone reductase-like Zn-dependent oxidoreductase